MRLLPLAHLHLSPCLRKGGQVVDATAGNGHDTLFLARSVGLSGCVHAFDINEGAISNTLKRLDDASLAACVQMHLASHACMADFVPAGQDAIIFNLGYLPGSSHDVVTLGEESLLAIKSALNLLRRGGRLCVMSYPAHRGGASEHQLISNFLQGLPLCDFTVVSTACLNGNHLAPVLFSVEKQCD